MGCGTVAQADPLDRVSGTESWRAMSIGDVENEWEHWLSARRLWRRARRVFALEAQRSRQLAAVLRIARGLPRDRVGPMIRRARRVRGRSRLRLPDGRPALPVERLDAKGQAIDEEGDHVLDEAFRDKREPQTDKGSR
ncbi:MAG: hypothetical protein H6707_08615 [Deltaproteobacteria bacterium]|nr:hypothetical protein [Deltaproteobacteria bacterium]